MPTAASRLLMPASQVAPPAHDLDYDFRGKGISWLESNFTVYGPANGNQWWGDSSRCGRYDKTDPPISFSATDGMLFTTDEAYDTGGSRYVTPDGDDAWWAAYIRKSYIPKYFDVSVESKFDDKPGFWTAPVWFGHSSTNLEMDVEYFPNVPNKIRFALHVKFDGDPSTTYNVTNSHGLGPHNITLPDPTGWHTYRCVVSDGGVDGMTFTWYLDGVEERSHTQAEIETAWGKTMNDAVTGSYPSGQWTMDVSLNMGTSLSCGPPDATTKGAVMRTKTLTVDYL